MDPMLNKVMMLAFKLAGKCGLCCINFLLASLQEVPTKASPYSGANNLSAKLDQSKIPCYNYGKLRAHLKSLLEATTTWYNKAATYKEGKTESHTC